MLAAPPTAADTGVAPTLTTLGDELRGCAPRCTGGPKAQPGGHKQGTMPGASTWHPFITKPRQL